VTRFSIEVLPEAEQEFHEAFLWYFERSPMAADTFRKEVLDAIDGLVELADMWPADDDGIHFHVLDKFPYTVHYDLNCPASTIKIIVVRHLNGKLATVLAIAHQHRRPNYWKTRG
jgi:plasmid stabilization system protein ParE